MGFWEVDSVLHCVDTVYSVGIFCFISFGGRDIVHVGVFC